MEWVFVMWITINNGSLTTQKMTEPQCKAAISEMNRNADPIMVYCYGPKGQIARTDDILDRIKRAKARQLQGQPAPAPEVPKAKPAGQTL